MGGIFDLERIQRWRRLSSCAERKSSEKEVPVSLNTQIPTIFITCESDISYESSIDEVEGSTDTDQAFPVAKIITISADATGNEKCWRTAFTPREEIFISWTQDHPTREFTWEQVAELLTMYSERYNPEEPNDDTEYRVTRTAASVHYRWERVNQGLYAHPCVGNPWILVNHYSEFEQDARHRDLSHDVPATI